VTALIIIQEHWSITQLTVTIINDHWILSLSVDVKLSGFDMCVVPLITAACRSQ